MSQIIVSIFAAFQYLLYPFSHPTTVRNKCRHILKRSGFKNDKDEDVTRPRALTVFLSLIFLLIFLVVSILGLFFPTVVMKRIVISVNALCDGVLILVFASDLIMSSKFTNDIKRGWS